MKKQLAYVMENSTISEVVFYDYVSLLAWKIIVHVTCEENGAYIVAGA